MVKTILKSAPFRKAKALLLKVPRASDRFRLSAEDYASNPPVIVNSLPKSGTHLLMQIANVLPGTKNYGSFIAQIPSISTRQRTQRELNKKITAIVPGEVVGAHLFYSKETATALKMINAIHLFIWRDPRDVILSEAHYLANMNRWHAMHKTFASLPDDESRVRLAITGTGYEHYPSAKERIGSYMGWLDDPECLAFRYDRLVDGVAQDGELERLLEYYSVKNGSNTNITIHEMKEAIRPEQSHTFNKGGVARWKQEMSAENLALCNENLNQWLID